MNITSCLSCLSIIEGSKSSITTGCSDIANDRKSAENDSCI